MPELFSSYRIAVLDSSFFISEFSPEIKNSLSKIKTYVAGTFNSELEQYKLFLSKDNLKIFNSNLSFMREKLTVNTFIMSSAGDKGKDLHNDIWGLITLLVRLRGNFIVITANQILIQRMVLNRVPADIYDLNTNTFHLASSYSLSSSFYEFGQVWSSPPKPAKVGKEGMTLYKTDGGSIVLENEIHSGLEGTLYKVKNQRQLIAKIFNKGELPAKKIANLKNIVGINKRYDIPFAAFPEELIYYDTGCSVPAGFTETLVSSGENLGENPLYLGNITDCPKSKLNTRLSDSIDLCLKVVRQVCYLNVLGFFISDFNYSNFSLVSQTNPYVQMWDVDSFGYGKYFSEIDAGYRLSRSYDYSTKKDAIASCYEELYLFAFSILSLGDYPISEKDGVFKYSKSDYLSRPIAQSRKKLIPNKLWNLFSDVFTHKKGPSAETLLDQLNLTVQELKSNPSQDKTYAELLLSELSVTNTSTESEIGESKDTSTATSEMTSKAKAAKEWIWVAILIVFLLLFIIFSSIANAEGPLETNKMDESCSVFPTFVLEDTTLTSSESNDKSAAVYAADACILLDAISVCNLNKYL